MVYDVSEICYRTVPLKMEHIHFLQLPELGCLSNNINNDSIDCWAYSKSSKSKYLGDKDGNFNSHKGLLYISPLECEVNIIPGININNVIHISVILHQTVSEASMTLRLI